MFASMPMRQLVAVSDASPPCPARADRFAVHRRSNTRLLRNDGCGQIVMPAIICFAFFCHVWHVGCVKVCVCDFGVWCPRSSFAVRRLHATVVVPSFQPRIWSLTICPGCSSLHAARARTTSPTIALHTKGRARQAFSLGHIVMRGARSCGVCRV